MDLAVVGCGAVAAQYVAPLDESSGGGGKRYGESLSLVASVDLDPERAASFADDHGCRPFTDLETMLETVDPDLVLVTTTHAAHAPVTEICLANDAHVFSEKPLALDAENARSLLTTAEDRGLALGCAPINDRGPHQRLAADRLADGTLGAVGVVSASANVGRVTEWHDRPDSFLSVGPLYDGAVYPLSLLVSWFGPVERVRTADGLSRYPARLVDDGTRPGSDEARPGSDAAADRDHPTHVEATLQFAAGPFCRLSASMYVPHRGREFYGLELHGDDASLYLEDTGDLGGASGPLVSVGRSGRGYTPVPPQRPTSEVPYLAGPAALAESVRRGDPDRSTARRGAHVVAVCNAIERAVSDGGPCAVDDCGLEASVYGPGASDASDVGHGSLRADRLTAPTWGTAPKCGGREVGAAPEDRPASLRLPPVGFGCSRYRDGDYVDRLESVEVALDAGYRLLDSAELYGNEAGIGDVLAAPGSPDRDAVFLVSKVWNTNHGHTREACEGSLDALGVDALDCYMLHWPESWSYTGPLRDLASLPVEEQEALTFPTDEGGETLEGDTSLEAAWRGLEALHDDGLARTLGVCNVDRQTLERIRSFARVRPAVVQVERHPYRPRSDLVDYCHERGMRVIAHSPLSAPGLLGESVLRTVADRHGATPAQVVVAWNVDRGVVPIPSSVDPDHVVENAAGAALSLTDADRAAIATLEDPDFER